MKVDEMQAMTRLLKKLSALRATLSDEERVACDSINPPGGVITNFHNTAGWMKTPSGS